MDAHQEPTQEYIFKPFHETYRKVATGLVFGLMYPNPAMERLQLTLLAAITIYSLPLMIIAYMDIYKFCLEGNIFDIISHTTIIGPVVGAITKVYLIFYKRVASEEIIDEINRDYEVYNSLPRDLKEVAASSIKSSKFVIDDLWVFAVVTAIFTFPGQATILTICSYIHDEQPKRYNIHDLQSIPFIEPDQRQDTPYFEILFIYLLVFCLVCYNYASYDGFLCIATSHACLKMTLYCKQLEKTFIRDDDFTKYDGIVNLATEQIRLYRYISLIQETFGIWLGIAFVATMIQIGSLLYTSVAGYGLNIHHSIFCVGVVLHIFLPCWFSSKLKHMSTETATAIYCSGWENVTERRIRQILPFMIARAQKTARITAFYLFEFDMELFQFIMKTSYTMYTLLRA